MLHIILLILKIIGWILLAVLGLLVLLVCIVFFVPLRYQADAACEGELRSLSCQARFSWLFHLIGCVVSYENEKLTWKVRIVWKKLSSEAEEESTFKTEEPVRSISSLPEQEQRPKKEALAKTAGPPARAVPEEKIQQKTPVKDKQKPDYFEAFCNRINKFFERLKYTFQKICDTIKSLLEKKDKLISFLTNEVHQSAFYTALRELKRLLHNLKPKKLHGSIHFGFDDPGITGKVLAALSIIWPFVGEHTDIRPDFEQKLLEGDIHIAGKIRVFYFIILLWNLFWTKDVRITYKHIRKFQL